jgi:hypothetical protein
MLGATMTSTLTTTTPNAPKTVIMAQSAIAVEQAQAAAKVQQSIDAYRVSLSKLYPAWLPLPTAPYPPSGDNSNFPRTGTRSLFVNQSQVNAAQLAEPQKVVYYQKIDAEARRPKLNGYFVIGAACLAGYFFVRRSST